MADIDNLLGSTRRVVEESEPLNNCRGVTYRVLNVGGGGGSTDYTKVVSKTDTMPTADADNANIVYMYDGESDATYTHGYIYENVPTTISSSASATQTVGSGLSDISVDLETLESFTGWTTDNSLQIFYTEDGWSVDTVSLGVTYTGTPTVGDAITITYTAESTTYAWTRIDVQPTVDPLPDQTGNAGKFLTTNGTSASWGDALTNTATGTDSLTIGGTASTVANSTNIGVGSESTGQGSIAVGNGAKSAAQSVAIGRGSETTAGMGVAIGRGAKVSAGYGIQLGGYSQTNSEQGTLYVGSYYNSTAQNYKLLDANGTIPESRLADTTNAQQGDVLTLDANGDAVWQAGSGGLPSQTGNAGKFLTTDGTDASWGNALANMATGNWSLTLLGNAASGNSSINVGSFSNVSGFGATCIGNNSESYAYSVAIGYNAGARIYSGTSPNDFAVAIGYNAQAEATGCVQIGKGTNSNANTFKVANKNGNFEIMDANGNLPADRLASTTGLADGNYRLRLTMANGVPTLSWVAE